LQTPEYLMCKRLGDPALYEFEEQPRALSVDNVDTPEYCAACIVAVQRLTVLYPDWFFYHYQTNAPFDGRAGVRALERRGGPSLPCVDINKKLDTLGTWCDFAAAYKDETRLIETGADIATAGAAALRLLPCELVQDIKGRVAWASPFPTTHLKSHPERWHGLPCMSCFGRLDSMYSCKCKMCAGAIDVCYKCFVHPPICIWCEPPTTVAFTGSRSWSDKEMVRDVLMQLPVDKTIIIHGACPTGLDAIVDRMARAMGFRVVPFHADWRQHGRAAGPIRNGRMLRAFDANREPIPDIPRSSVVYAFPHGDSRGTADCISKAEALGIRVIVHKPLDH